MTRLLRHEGVSLIMTSNLRSNTFEPGRDFCILLKPRCPPVAISLVLEMLYYLLWRERVP